ncbi:MAG: CPBP family intramembrane glutamic endopeptidase [Bradymonadales bacterium]|jgi:membrane protease YdiL (CAAX protease family)
MTEDRSEGAYHRQDRKISLTPMLLLYALMFVISDAIAFFALQKPLFAPWPKPWIHCVGLGVVVAAGVIVLDRLIERLSRVARALNERFIKLLGPLKPSDCLLLALASSLGEEALFRGVLLPFLGFVPSSIIFGLMHWGGRDKVMWLWTIIATGMGFAFGAMTLYTGNIVAATIAHFFINFINLLRISRQNQEP